MAEPGKEKAAGEGAGRRKKAAAVLFACAGLFALALSGWYGYGRYRRENPRPLPDVIAPIPEGEREALRTGMRVVGKTILRLSPDQEKKVTEIWKKTPRSLDEIIEMQKATNRLLTPQQRARLDPLRKAFQGRIVDQMLEPARDRFGGEDFEKLKKTVKERVEERVSGP